MQADTIAAIATAPGVGAISIIKISGPQAFELVDKVFRARRPGVRISELPTHRLVVGDIIDGSRILDEVLVSVMRGPGSYTGEDVAEVNCHGGYVAARSVLELLLKQGCRLADPGEFTRRAFLNGRLSLEQAEAVIDVINANSRQGLEMAVSTLRGKAGGRLAAIEDKIIELSALVEASIDFPEEVGELDEERALGLVKAAAAEVRNLVAWAERGRIYREGLKVVISGKPNVGKSSLLNLLLNENRVIVSDIPGTTRDTIEDNIEVNGILVRLIDTAGIRAAGDQIEAMGIARSRAAMKEADVVIVVLDVGTGLTAEDEEILEFLRELKKQAILLINKVDLPERKITAERLQQLSQLGRVIEASVKDEQGITELVDAIFELGVGSDIIGANPGLLANMRQKAALEMTLTSLDEVIKAISSGVSLDCLAVDVMAARDNLGEVTGRTIREEVVDRIFSEFCIGK